MKVNWKKWGWTLILFAFLIYVPPTIYTVSFCSDWRNFGDMWLSTFHFWGRVLMFVLALLIAVLLLLIIIAKLIENLEEEVENERRRERRS